MSITKEYLRGEIDWADDLIRTHKELAYEYVEEGHLDDANRQIGNARWAEGYKEAIRRLIENGVL